MLLIVIRIQEREDVDFKDFEYDLTYKSRWCISYNHSIILTYDVGCVLPSKSAQGVVFIDLSTFHYVSHNDILVILAVEHVSHNDILVILNSRVAIILLYYHY